MSEDGSDLGLESDSGVCKLSPGFGEVPGTGMETQNLGSTSGICDSDSMSDGRWSGARLWGRGLTNRRFCAGGLCSDLEGLSKRLDFGVLLGRDSSYTSFQIEDLLDGGESGI